MSSEQALSANEEFTNFVTYFANHVRDKEAGLKEAIECGEVTTEEERDEFLLCTEPLEEGFSDLPEGKQCIIDRPSSRDEQERYSDRMDSLSAQARQLLQRKGELGSDVDPRIVEFVEEVATRQTIDDKLRAEARDNGYEDEDEIEEEIPHMDVDSGDYDAGMQAFDAFIVKARGIVGHPEPIAIPDAAAPAF